jgi:lauroyl/myristoyl acyltransferase
VNWFGSTSRTPSVGDQLRQAHWGSKRWATWQNLGMLLVVAVLPFGWLLPAARLARVAVRRRPNF